MAEKQYLFDKPQNVKRVLVAFLVLCAVLVMLEFVVHRHVEHSWENLLGFYPLYGFLSYVLLVVISRWLRALLKRPEDYYVKDEQEKLKQEDSGNLKGEASHD